MENQRQLFQRHIAQPSDFSMGLEVDHANSSYIYTKDGKKYIDLISGIAVSNVGHCHPSVVKAIKSQAEKHMHTMVYGEHIQTSQVAYAHELSKYLPESLSNVFFTNSGTEAVDGALKLSRKHTGRTKIISCRNSYHGSSYGAISLMDDPGHTRPYLPGIPGTHFIRFNNMVDINRIDSSTACVVMEVVQGEAGYIPSKVEFINAVRDKCTKEGTLLVFDEIQSGMGRTGKLFAFEHYGVKPDILLLAKALGGGLPLGAFISSRKIMDSMRKNPALTHLTTFGGNPVSCAAGLAALKVIQDERLLDQVVLGRKLLDELFEKKIGKTLGGKGYMASLTVKNSLSVKRTIKHSFENGILLDWFLFNEKSLRLAPPLNISSEDLEYVVDVFSRAFSR